MTRFGRTFWINILFFGVYAVLTFFQSLYDHSFLRISASVITLIVIFPLTGLNATLLLEKISHQKFTNSERLSIATIFSFLVLPIFITIESAHFNTLSPTTPLINSLAIFLLTILFSPLSLESTQPEHIPKTLFWSFGIAFFLYFFLIFFTVTAYYPLPDSDPYYWAPKIQTEVDTHSLPALHIHRPLLSSLTYMFHATANVDFYAFFKYVLPFFFMLTIIPAFLVARHFPNQLQQLAILFIPLGSASFITYSLLPIPQATLNLSLVFFVYLLLYSWLEKKLFFYFLAGFVSFATLLYHEAAFLIFLVWLTITIIRYRDGLLNTIRKNILSSILIVIIFLYNLPLLQYVYGFLANWLKRLNELITISSSLNLTFPLHYVNIDGNNVGWETLSGIFKYYAFYVGPTTGFVLCISLILFIFPAARTQLWEHIRKNQSITPLAGTFLLFFTLAEILPRFLNIAFLPERSWGFAGLFLIGLLPLIFRILPSRQNFIAIILIAAYLINAGAFLYINSLKKNTIPSSHITAMEWVKNNLPKNAIILAYGNRGMIQLHTQTETIDITNPKFYSDISVFDSFINSVKLEISDIDTIQANYLATTSLAIETIKKTPPENRNELLNTLDIISTESIFFENKLRYSQKNKHDIPEEKPLFIYYTRPNNNTLYSDRPYSRKKSDELVIPIFDTYPDRFQRVYSAADNEIIVWKFITKK